MVIFYYEAEDSSEASVSADSVVRLRIPPVDTAQVAPGERDVATSCIINDEIVPEPGKFYASLLTSFIDASVDGSKPFGRMLPSMY